MKSRTHWDLQRLLHTVSRAPDVFWCNPYQYRNHTKGDAVRKATSKGYVTITRPRKDMLVVTITDKGKAKLAELNTALLAKKEDDQI